MKCDGLKQCLLAAGLAVSLTTAAQSVDELKSKYPGEQAVMLNSTTQYKIKLK